MLTDLGTVLYPSEPGPTERQCVTVRQREASSLAVSAIEEVHSVFPLAAHS